VQVTEKEVKSFEATQLGHADNVIGVGLEETSGRIVCEATIVNGSATTKFVIDPASGESNGQCMPWEPAAARRRTRAIRARMIGVLATRDVRDHRDRNSYAA
jgi:hypothetical protein